MRSKNIAALAILVASLVCLAGEVNAAPISWNIVSSASSVSFAIPSQVLTITSSDNIVSLPSATKLIFTYRGFNPSTTASTSAGIPWTVGNKQNLSGFFTTDTDFATSITFLSGLGANQITGIDSGSFWPLPDGSEPGTASADIATRVWLNSGALGAGLNLDLALRDIFYGLDSGSVPIALGSFNSDAVSFGTLAQEVAYHGRNPFQFNGSEFRDRVGSGLDNSLDAFMNNSAGAANGNIVIDSTPGGDVAKLTVPFNLPITFKVQTDEVEIPLNIILTGTIVATAVVPEPATIGMLAVGMAMLAPMAVSRWRKRE